MSKVKYIIEVDKEDIDIFLTGMNENYIIHQYDGEEAVCGRVLLSAFKTATPLTECNDMVSRQEILNYLTEQLNFNEDRRSSENYTGHWVEEEQYSHAVDVLEKFDEYVRALPSVLPKSEGNGKGIITSNFKEGDWFILPGDRIFKILAPGMFSTAVRQMIKAGNDYVEGAIYIMHPNFIKFNAKRYEPHEAENEATNG